MALYNRSVILAQLGRWDDELQACDQLARRFIGTQGADICRMVAMALCNKGVGLRARNKVARLGQLGRPTQALGACDQLFAQLGGEQDPEIQAALPITAGHRSLLLDKLGRSN